MVANGLDLVNQSNDLQNSLNELRGQLAGYRIQVSYLTSNCGSILKNSCSLSLLMVYQVLNHEIYHILQDNFLCPDNFFLIYQNYQQHILSNYNLYSRVLNGDISMDRMNLFIYYKDFWLNFSEILNYNSSLFPIRIKDSAVQAPLSKQIIHVEILSLWENLFVDDTWMCTKDSFDWSGERLNIGVFNGYSVEPLHSPSPFLQENLRKIAKTSHLYRSLLLEAQGIYNNSESIQTSLTTDMD